MTNNRWKCWKCCKCMHICTSGEMRLDNCPISGTEMYACPACKSMGTLEAMCEVAGCAKPAICGGPGEDGVYRLTCSDHECWATWSEAVRIVARPVGDIPLNRSTHG